MEHKHDPVIYIIFPIYNRLDETKRFLDSLAQQSPVNYKLVICDDGSTDGTADYLNSNHPDIIVLNGDGNLWWTAGINKCVKYVLSVCHDSDFILTINNDVLLPTKYLAQKLERSTNFPTAIIGSLCVYADNTDLIETSGYIMNYKSCLSTQLNKPGDTRNDSHKGITDVTHLPGKGVMFPIQVFKDIGLYDEINLPQYHADTDLVLRAHENGYRVLVDYDAVLLSEVNTNNMVLPTHNITLKGIANTFIGPYSINNFRIRNNFAKKHFPKNRIRYVILTYFKIVAGFGKRYIKYRI